MKWPLDEKTVHRSIKFSLDKVKNGLDKENAAPLDKEKRNAPR